MAAKKRPKARIGLVGYVDILARLQGSMKRAGDASIPQIVAEGEFGKNVLYNLLPSMWRLGRLHIVGWELRIRCKAVPIFAYGPGEDVPRPTHRYTTQKRRVYAAPVKPPKRIKPEVLALESVLAALDRSCTRKELAARTGLCNNTVDAVIRALHEQHLAHISHYIVGRFGKPPAVYALGRGKDAPKPVRTKAEVNARYRQRLAVMQVPKAAWQHMAQTLASANDSESLATA